MRGKCRRRKTEDGRLLRRFQAADLRPLLTAAAADQHHVATPTHVLERDGKILGYGSIGKVMLISGWTAEAVTDEDSRQCLEEMEAAARAAGAVAVAVACTADCRFLRVIRDYKTGKPASLFFKKL